MAQPKNNMNEKTENKLEDGQRSDAATCSVGHWINMTDEKPNHEEHVFFMRSGKVVVGRFVDHYVGVMKTHCVYFFETGSGTGSTSFGAVNPRDVDCWQPIIIPEPN